MTQRDLIWGQYDARMQLLEDGAEPGIERYNPQRFKREMTVFRIGHLASRIVELGDKLELPTGSILHLMDDVDQPIHSDVPRVDDNTFIQRESFRKYIYHVRDFDLADGPVTVEDKYIYRISGLPRNLMSFRSKYGSKFRYCNTLAEIPTKKEALVIVNHNPLFRVRLYGRLQYFRRTELILASVLNTIHRMTFLGKQQFLLLPWGTEVYDKQMFVRSRNALTPVTVRYPDNFHYILMTHLVNFMWDKATTSLFRQLAPEDLQQLTLILQCGNKYIFYNLADLQALNLKNIAYFRFVNQLNLLSVLGRLDETTDPQVRGQLQTHIQQLQADQLEDPQLTSDLIKSIYETKQELSRTPEEYTPPTTETRTNAATTTGDIEASDEDNPVTTETTTERIIQRAAAVIPEPVKKIVSPVSTAIPRAAQPAQIVSQRQVRRGVLKTKVTNSARPTTATTAAAAVPPTIEYMRQQESQAMAFIDAQPQLTPKQKERVKILAHKYQNLELHGRKLKDILTKDTDTSIDLDPIPENILGIEPPDKAALASSPHAYDVSYMKKTFDRHFVGAINSFQRNGVFLTGVKEHKVISELNNYTDYSLQYEDINGQKSTIKIRMPTVNRDGRFVVDGIPKVLRKQRVTLPIVKTSETTISLSSNYNKTQVIRNTTKAHNFFSYIEGLVNSAKSKAVVVYGNCKIRDIPLSYEYTQIADKYKSITWQPWNLWFDYDHRLEHFGSDADKLLKLETEYGVYFGHNDTSWLFVDEQNRVTAVRFQGGEDPEFPYTTIREICLTSLKPGETYNKQLTEWISIKILDKMLPVIFLLGYRYGLRNTLDYLGVEYVITENGRGRAIVGGSTDNPTTGKESFGVGSDRVAGGIGLSEDQYFGTDWIKIRNSDDTISDIAAEEALTEEQRYTPVDGDIALKFADRTIWIKRYPLAKSLIVCGLDALNTENYALADFESKDIYYQVLIDQGLSTNYLKGIDSFFDLFIDNMTFEVLKSMHEPTNVRDLLIRCGVLLSTMDHRQPSSRLNHRIRGYEQFNAVLYNEMARQFAAYQSRRGAGNKFTINPDAIYLRIVTNSSLVPSECPNPIQDLKEQTAMTYAGAGGRTSESFVVEDRKFAKDDIGVISESTVDNGKVGINAQLAFNAGIADTNGTLQPAEELTAGDVLSVTSVTFPFITHDDKMNLVRS